MIIFETDRLVIREVMETDWSVLEKIYTDPTLMKYISSGRSDWTLEEIKEKYNQVNSPRHHYGLWIVVGKEHGLVMGEGGLFHTMNDLSTLELGYILDIPWHRQGYGKELAMGLMQYAKEKLSVRKIIARMYKENDASVSLSESCGMICAETGRLSDGREFCRYEKRYL